MKTAPRRAAAVAEIIWDPGFWAEKTKQSAIPSESLTYFGPVSINAHYNAYAEKKGALPTGIASVHNDA